MFILTTPLPGPSSYTAKLAEPLVFTMVDPSEQVIDPLEVLPRTLTCVCPFVENSELPPTAKIMFLVLSLKVREVWLVEP